MRNVKQIWQETVKQLQKVYDQREAENIGYLLLEDIFAITRADVISEHEMKISQEELDVCILRLLNNEPLQYVTGIADFYGRKFSLSSGALIPRPETEELCELIINENKISHPKIVDVGVGSGCIAITLAAELKGTVYGIDVSDDAIAIAENNSEELQVVVDFIQSDILKDSLPTDELDILVSNPPYIPYQDQGKMRTNVLRYEPELALFVKDENPLVFYKRIAKLGIQGLKPNGRLYFEIHESFGEEVKDYLENIGYLGVRIHKDMQGKNRMISATNSANR